MAVIHDLRRAAAYPARVDASFDLNLLRVFDAVMREGSVTRAARSLHVTQSTVSHALARLRAAVGDPLVVRRGNAMHPTSTGRRLAVEVHDIMGRIRANFAPAEFEAASSRRRFVFALPDTLVGPFGIALLGQVAVRAPHAGLELRRLTDTTADELAAGSVDAALSVPGRLVGALRSAPLLDVTWQAVVNSTHPLAGATPDLAELARWPHAVVADAPVTELVGSLLAARGLERRIGVVLTTSALVTRVVGATELIGFVPSTEHLEQSVRSVALPPEVHGQPHHLFWGAAEADPACAWFVATLLATAAAITDG